MHSESFFTGSKHSVVDEKVMTRKGIEYKIPVASDEYTKYIEQKLTLEYDKLEEIFSTMQQAVSLDQYVAENIMCFDIERGLGIGQLPHIHFRHSLTFLRRERRIFRLIENRHMDLKGGKTESAEKLLPFERSYWVIPGKLLAGEIPSSSSTETRVKKVKGLVDLGVTTIINLMEEGEKTFEGHLLKDYQKDLEKAATNSGRRVEVVRYPIRDLSIAPVDLMKKILAEIDDRLKNGEVVYVHCWGGVGGTGTVIGCYLIEKGMVSAELAIDMINYLKRTTSIKDRKSPETDEQAEYVMDWPLLREHSKS